MSSCFLIQGQNEEAYSSHSEYPCCFYATNVNVQALKFFNEQINIIQKSVKKHANVTFKEVDAAIRILEKVTEISSTADGNYFGRFNPSQIDYDKWKVWLEKNIKNIRWDDIKNDMLAMRN